MQESPGDLGRRLVAEMRQHWDETWDYPEPADDLLRWGADSLDEDAIWGALLAALDAAQGETELWILADGLVTETVLIRATLLERFRQLVLSGHPSAVALAATMVDERSNWDGPESVEWWDELLEAARAPSADPTGRE